MNKQEEEFEEFEEFEDGEDDEEDENGTTIPEDDEEEVQEEEEVVEAPKPVKKKVVVKKTQPEVPAKTPEPQIQYVGVPRAVTMEEMMNKVFDDIQELKQMVNALLTQNE